MIEPLISVIITSYNYADLITTAIESVISQTYKNWELIIIDDGSKDNSLEVIKKYETVNLYQHANAENKGLVESLKLGVSKAKGNYIAFLECDDIWDENYLKEKIELLNKNPNIKLIFNDIEAFGDEVECRKTEKIFLNKIRNTIKKKATKNFAEEILNFCIIPTFSCVLIEKNALKTLNFNSPIPNSPDWWLWTQLAVDNDFLYLDKKLTKWRQHSESYTKKSNKNTLKSHSEVMFKKEISQFILKNNFKTLIKKPILLTKIAHLLINSSIMKKKIEILNKD